MNPSGFKWAPRDNPRGVTASFEQYPDESLCYFVLEGETDGEWIRSAYVAELEQ